MPTDSETVEALRRERDQLRQDVRAFAEWATHQADCWVLGLALFRGPLICTCGLNDLLARTSVICALTEEQP